MFTKSQRNNQSNRNNQTTQKNTTLIVPNEKDPEGSNSLNGALDGIVLDFLR